MKGYYGEGIRYYRDVKNKMKQEALAYPLKMSRQNLSEIEQNKRRVSEEVLQQIAAELGTTPEKIKEYGKSALAQHPPPLQMEQHNQHTVQIPLSLFEALQMAIKTNQEALQIAHAYIAEMKLRLSKHEL